MSPSVHFKGVGYRDLNPSHGASEGKEFKGTQTTKDRCQATRRKEQQQHDPRECRWRCKPPKPQRAAVVHQCCNRSHIRSSQRYLSLNILASFACECYLFTVLSLRVSRLPKSLRARAAQASAAENLSLPRYLESLHMKPAFLKALCVHLTVHLIPSLRRDRSLRRVSWTQPINHGASLLLSDAQKHSDQDAHLSAPDDILEMYLLFPAAPIDNELTCHARFG
jgi:hypothetical protein